MGRERQKAAKRARASIRRQIAEHVKSLCPGCTADFVGQGGHAAKTSRTFGFRVLDSRGKFRSNIVWVDPSYDGPIDEGWVRSTVGLSKG